MTTIYLIVETTRHCYGHGDYGNITKLHYKGAYDSGPPSPAFQSKEDADTYLDTLSPYSNARVMEIELK